MRTNEGHSNSIYKPLLWYWFIKNDFQGFMDFSLIIWHLTVIISKKCQRKTGNRKGKYTFIYKHL